MAESKMQAIREWHDVDENIFRNNIEPLYEPAVLRGVAKTWPAVALANQSTTAIADYLKNLDRGAIGEMFVGDKAIDGRYFYSDDLRGMNFKRKKEHFRSAIDKIVQFANENSEQTAYLGSMPVFSSIPDFVNENSIPFLDKRIEPRIWLGNKTTVSSHYDLSHNIACVVSGQRKFTLISPHQIKNLYVGPLEFTIAGQPVSMANLENPDFDKHPKFAEALETAQEAVLEPGDAIFIPTLWWHHVKSLSPFNVLVNYWWNDNVPGQGDPFEALIHGIYAIRNLPDSQRSAWREIFEHYIFNPNISESSEHLPNDFKGILAPLTPELAAKIRNFLIGALTHKK